MFERLKAIHWMWWAVWMFSVTWLGAVIVHHPTEEVKVLAEQLRPFTFNGLLPVHVLLHRDLAKAASWTLCLSVALAAGAVCRPAKAQVLVPLAVGLAFLFFAFHTLFYSYMATAWMRATVHERAPAPAPSRP